jgi:hypothetical protein
VGSFLAQNAQHVSVSAFAESASIWVEVRCRSAAFGLLWVPQTRRNGIATLVGGRIANASGILFRLCSAIRLRAPRP